MNVSPRIKLASLLFAATAACAPTTPEGKTCNSAMREAGISDPRAVTSCVEILTDGQTTSPNKAARDLLTQLSEDGILTDNSLNQERLVIVRHQFDMDALPLGLHKEGW